jgi:hypothetical protein
MNGCDSASSSRRSSSTRRARDRHECHIETDAERLAQRRDRVEAQAIARVTAVLVGAVFVRAFAELLQHVFEGAAARAQQGAHEQYAVLAVADPARFGNAGEPARAGAAQHAEQHRFQVVIGVVGRDEQACRDLGGDFLEGVIAGLAQGVFVGTNLRKLQPPHGDRQVQAVAEVDDVLGGLPAVRTHAMVNMADVQGARQAALGLQAGQRKQQCGAVRTTRYRR